MNFDAEWIISNRNATYSSSSISFANLRTYHGIFVKNVSNSYDRMVLLSKFFEEIEINGNKINLDSNYYPGTIYPEGRNYLINYKNNPAPEFTYQYNGFQLIKRIVLDPNRDLLIIKYDFNYIPDSIKLYPLLSFRNYNDITRKGYVHFDYFKMNEFYKFSANNQDLYISENGNFIKDDLWYYNFQYPVDMKRGSNYVEDLYLPGHFDIKPEKSIEIVIHSENGFKNSETFDSLLKKYKASMIKPVSNNKYIKKMEKASTVFFTDDNFLAGYYWFGAWGRDTFISMPGLALIPKKFDFAKNILLNYMKNIRNGIVPKTMNLDYDSADVSLCFIYAVYKYYEYSGDIDTVDYMMPDIKKILDAYINGNEYYGLDNYMVITKKGQLTWMDAKYNDIIFTPRTGKPIEINALWYNALKTYEFFSEKLDMGIQGIYKEIIKGLEKNFESEFFRGDKIYDVLPDDYSLRPNFLLSFSLPFNIMKNFNRYKKTVDELLLTPYGLRSLSKKDENYIPVYEGDRFHRDKAYHNGAIWPWLIGPYISASVKSGNDKSKLKKYFDKVYKMDKIPELFQENGEPSGCILQAWSYGEIIRSYFEDIGGE